MKLITPPLTDSDNISFDHDILIREKHGKSLKHLITNSSDKLVISIDAKWGEGKTTFLKMWQNQLSKTENPISNIYIDCFANDFIDDPFITVVSAITSYAEQNGKTNLKSFDDFKKSAKKIGLQVLKISSKAALRAATLNIISGEDIGAIKNDLIDTTSKFTEDFIEERINSHKTDIDFVHEFTNTLSSLASDLSNKTGNPLVIIIDELDRCKPTYAVEMIEKIKHLFSIDNIVFILAIHKRQLEEAVKCVYGQGIDAHNYLQKFINLEFSLPKRKATSHNNDLNKYYERLYRDHNFSAANWERIYEEQTYNYATSLANHFDISLRQFEKFFTNLAIYHLSTDNENILPTSLVVFICIIKVIDPETFNCLKQKKITYTEISNKTNLLNYKQNHPSANNLLPFLRSCLYSENELNENKINGNEDIKHCINFISDNFGSNRNELLPTICSIIGMFNTN